MREVNEIFYNLLILVIPILAELATNANSQASKEMTFYKNDAALSLMVSVDEAISLTSTDYDTTEFDTASTESPLTAVQCGFKCMSNSDTSCTAYLYNSETGVCMYNLDRQTLQSYYREGYGDVYAGCDTSNGYKTYSQNGVVACLSQINQPMTYREASSACSKSGGYLVSVKTVEKLDLLRDYLSTDSAEMYWVGLYEGDKEIFYWEEDGSAITATEEVTVLETGGISDYVGACVALPTTSKSLLQAEKCESAETSFVCEMMINMESLLYA